MYNMSSAMASQFVEATIEMTENIMKLGTNPLRTLHPNPLAKEQRL
jgi:hypothetical protein